MTITRITVPPRIHRFKIDKHDVVVEYNPETGKWSWTAYVSRTYQLHGMHNSLDLASAAAKKAVKKFSKDNTNE